MKLCMQLCPNRDSKYAQFTCKLRNKHALNKHAMIMQEVASLRDSDFRLKRTVKQWFDSCRETRPTRSRSSKHRILCTPVSFTSQCVCKYNVLEYWSTTTEYSVFGKLLGAGAAGAFARGAGLQVFVALVLYRISPVFRE
jgi:hypothetical protein